MTTDSTEHPEKDFRYKTAVHCKNRAMLFSLELVKPILQLSKFVTLVKTGAGDRKLAIAWSYTQLISDSII